MIKVRQQYHHILQTGDSQRLSDYLTGLTETELLGLATDFRFTRSLLEGESAYIADLFVGLQNVA